MTRLFLLSYFPVAVMLSPMLDSSSAYADLSQSTATTTSSGTSSGTSSISERGSRTNWAVEIAGTGRGIGPRVSGPNPTDTELGVFSGQVEFQPIVLPGLGIIGFGPSVAGYNPLYGTEIDRKLAYSWSVGAQIRFQLLFTNNQPVVPMVTLGAEDWHYRLGDGNRGSFWISGPTAGLWVLLNALDPDRADSFFSATGIRKTYAAMEYRGLSGSDSIATLESPTYYFGLRFEL